MLFCSIYSLERIVPSCLALAANASRSNDGNNALSGGGKSYVDLKLYYNNSSFYKFSFSWSNID